MGTPPTIIAVFATLPAPLATLQHKQPDLGRSLEALAQEVEKPRGEVSAKRLE
ncbi:MAG: hypothetical protein ACO3JG_01890 [Luteolibacter sp.]